MNKMMAIVALVVMACVGNSNALPRQAEECSDADAQAMEGAITNWAVNLLSQNPSSEAAALSVIKSCDDDQNGVLTPAEFAACLRKQVNDDSISSSCFAYLELAGDMDSDGSVGVKELIELFSAITQANKKEKRSHKRARRDLTEEMCPEKEALAMQSALSAWLKKLLANAKPAEVVAQILKTCDANGDGSLSSAEFVKCLQDQLNIDISASCFDIFLMYVDMNGNGVIEASEIEALVNMMNMGLRD